jgi:hypothetical protein
MTSLELVTFDQFLPWMSPIIPTCQRCLAHELTVGRRRTLETLSTISGEHV